MGKSEKFIRDFVEIYIEKYYLEIDSIKDEEKIRNINEKIKEMLPHYSILFKDVKVLQNIFEEVKKGEVFTINFESFLNWIVQTLYEEKIIDEQVFNELNKQLSKLNFKIRKLSMIELGGAGFV